MPTYTLIRRYEDGTEEQSDLNAELGSGIEQGRTIVLDGEEWTIVDVTHDGGQQAIIVVSPGRSRSYHEPNRSSTRRAT
jgi:hypothetical protein